MSHEGKMSRGKFYQGKSNLADNIKDDVAYFLENSKPEEVVKEVKKKVKKDVS
jgi:hypothetical protein